MDYSNAIGFIKNIPLPIFFVHVKSGKILFTNQQAEESGFVIGDSFFNMLEESETYAYIVKTSSQTECKQTVKVIIHNRHFIANLSISKIIYNKLSTLLIAVTRLNEVKEENKEITIANICDIFTNKTGRKQLRDFLAVTAKSAGAFSVAIYQKHRMRYVLKEEWRDRKNVCIPILSANFETRQSAEIQRIARLKRAQATFAVPYHKKFGETGVVIYFLDKKASKETQQNLEEYVDLYCALVPDYPRNERSISATQGMDVIGEGIAVWDAATRRILYANKAYRKLFGFHNSDYLSSSLLADKLTNAKTQIEDYKDSRGRSYSIVHTKFRINHRTTVSTIVKDVTHYKQAENKLNLMAKTDALTGLNNRRAGLEQLRQIYTECKRENRPLTVCFADIDGLKYINDTYGHGAGDVMIKSVASVLKKHIDKIGVVCRLGGDEFVLILPGMNKVDAQVLTTQIDKDSAHCLIGNAEGVSMSFGFKEADFTAVETADMLISVADSNMYHEKRKKTIKSTL